MPGRISVDVDLEAVRRLSDAEIRDLAGKSDSPNLTAAMLRSLKAAATDVREDEAAGHWYWSWSAA